jgi:hypothetical protein
VRIRANADAPNQTAILQATDVSSGAFRPGGRRHRAIDGHEPRILRQPRRASRSRVPTRVRARAPWPRRAWARRSTSSAECLPTPSRVPARGWP